MKSKFLSNAHLSHPVVQLTDPDNSDNGSKQYLEAQIYLLRNNGHVSFYALDTSYLNRCQKHTSLFSW